MIGQNIGKYRVLDRIGRGGMGTVYRAVDETLHREVAIKVLNAELNDPSVARRFRAEAVTVARLNHPGIATVYELFQHEGQWLMVMEFVRGETLEALVTRKGSLPHTEAVDLCMQALAALAHAHSLGVVHRDLKPANIMFTESGAVKVMDFGIARVVGTEHLTSAGFMMGTPAYMAPEQVLGGDIDARADIYAIGVVLYHLLTGQLPFRGNTPFEMAQSRLRDQPTPVRTVRAELPEWLGTILQISLNREPAQRFQSAATFRESLRRGLANLPLETDQSPVVPPELVATAAPSSLPVATSSMASPPLGTAPIRGDLPKPPPSPATDPSTLKTPLPVVPVAAMASNSRAWTKVALVAGVIIVAGILAWTTLRSPARPSDETPSPPPAPTLAAQPLPASDPTPTVSAEPAPSESAPAAPVAASLNEKPAGTPPAGPEASMSPGASRAMSPVTQPTSTSTSSTGPRAGTAPANALARGSASSRGRGAEPEAAIDFKDSRLLVVVGNRAEEQPGVLNFAEGRVAVVSEKNGATLVSIPYTDVTYAVYTRAKDPKWSPVLAAPPATVDLPGGLFSPARHWLALQSRASFLIVRLSDGNWRQVLEAVKARTGLEVQLSGSSD